MEAEWGTFIGRLVGAGNGDDDVGDDGDDVGDDDDGVGVDDDKGGEAFCSVLLGDRWPLGSEADKSSTAKGMLNLVLNYIIVLYLPTSCNILPPQIFLRQY